MKELRRYIRNALLMEGIAGHGNKLLLLKIIDEIEAGNYEFLGDAQPHRGTGLGQTIAFRLTRPGLENVWTSATPELRDFLEKKFTTQDFFVRNLARMKWMIVNSYDRGNVLGQASNSMGDEGGWRNKNTGEELFPGDDLHGDEAKEKIRNIQYKGANWRKRNGWVKAFRRSAAPLNRDTVMRYNGGYISVKEANAGKFNALKQNGADGRILANWFRNRLQGPDTTWEHEFQHWIQYLSYFSTRDDRSETYSSSSQGRNAHPGTRGPVSDFVLNMFNAMFNVQVKVDEARIEAGKTIVPIVPGSLTRSEISNHTLKSREAFTHWWMTSILRKELAKSTPDEAKLNLVWSAVAEHVPSTTREEFLTDEKYISEMRNLGFRSTNGIAYKFAFEFYDEKGKIVKSAKKWVEKAVALGFWRVTSRGRQRYARMNQARYTSKWDNRSGLNTEWEDSIMEWDAELAAKAAKLVREVTQPNTHQLQARQLLVKLFVSDTEEAKVHVSSILKKEMKRFEGRSKIVREQYKSFNNTVKKITDYLQECADRVDSEAYITPRQWSSIGDDYIDQFNTLKALGWIEAFQNEINQTNYT